VTTYLTPGVYIEEVPSGPQPITAVSSSVLAVIGSTRRGPVKSPTRITNWSDFQRVFRGNAIEGGFTAETVYGFFENGGPAAYVVRVDPSVAGIWQAKFGPGNDDVNFAVTASSPGSWAENLVVSVAPDQTSGAGTLFMTTVEAAENINDNNNHELQVASTSGVSVGDTVTLLADDSAATTRTATVMAVAAGRLTVRRVGAGNISLRRGCVVTIAVDPAAAQFTLSGGAGIKAGDVLVAETAARPAPTASWRVTSVSSHGASLVITPALPAAFANPLPGATFGPRIVHLSGTLPAPSAAAVPLAAISWSVHPDFVPTNATMTAGLRAWAANGMEGVWVAAGGDANTFRFPAAPPVGPITVEAALIARAFSEPRQWVDPTEAELAAAYSFLPTGSVLTLVGAGGTANVDVTRTATGFSGVPAAAGTYSAATLKLPTDSLANGAVLQAARPPQAGDRVHFANARILAVQAVEPAGGTTYKVTFQGPTADISGDTGSFVVRAFTPTKIAPLRFSLSVTGSAGGETFSETFKGLALDPAHPQYYGRDGVINEVSSLVTVTPGAPVTPSVANTPSFTVAVQAGADRPPTSQDFKEAVAALETAPEPAMLCCPDLLTFDDPLLQYDLVDAMVRHCEEFRRFAVLDAPMGTDDAVLKWRNTAVSSTYAAVFAPFVRIVSLEPGATERLRWVPPSGFVAGVMARTDRERGVHKAPGNERVSGIVGLSQAYTDARQDLLNPAGVNLIRAFPSRGMRIWGARNATDDVQWRYISVRRLFNVIEVSTERSTQWVVFEPNTATTWLRVKASVEGFLDQLWRAGALAGASPEEAYRVRVGLGQTMTETDIDLGLIITEVAVAPAKPAEFVIFRFSHKRLTD
jgi:uncharacterized protein